MVACVFVGLNYRNSTIIVGDSNSKWLTFGEGEGSFGKALPGKRINAANVCDVNPLKCAAYSTVVIMAGTNDLRPSNVSNTSDVQQLVGTLKNKVDVLLAIRKNIKVVLLPVLPTRLTGMNHLIFTYNSTIHDYFITRGACFNISMPSTNQFFDRDYMLQKQFLRRSDDAIHLSSKGLAVLAKIIKTHILGYRRFKDSGTLKTALGAGLPGSGAT